MSVFKIIFNKEFKLLIWEIKESLEDLEKIAPEIKLENKKNTKRNIEFIIPRILLKYLSKNLRISYNYLGAPTLNNNENISISHTKEFVAIIISKKSVGIDIEKISNKAKNLSTKFIKKEQRKNLNDEKATLIWSLKEAIFKSCLAKGVNFVTDITFSDFDISQNGKIKGEFRGEKIMANYEKIFNHYLVYVCK